MTALQQFFVDNWLAVLVVAVALTILIVLLWRNYDIDEITPGPPFIRFKRKASAPHPPESTASVRVSRNFMWGKNRISVRRENSEVTDNPMLGENEVEVGAKPGPKPKAKKGKQSK